MKNKKKPFATVDVLPGRTNACVKNLMKQMGITDANEAVRRINSGRWVVQPNIRFIDCNAQPFISAGCTVEEHKKGGLIIFDPMKISLWLSDKQKTGYIVGHELRQELANKPVLNANVLDHWLKYPELIPEDCKNKIIPFWGTIYRRNSNGSLVVRCLNWDGSQWHWNYYWLGSFFNSDNPAVVAKAQAEITYPEYLIDCNADPFLPNGCSVEEHRKGGLMIFDPAKISFYLSDKQKTGSINGHELRQELANQPVLNANVVDHWLKYPELIPEECKSKATFFWGTIYRNSLGSLYVRCLVWEDSQWRWVYGWLGSNFDSDNPAVVAKAQAEIAYPEHLEHLIDTDADPFLPEGWRVEKHKIGGMFQWNLNKLSLYLSKKQKAGHIVGHELKQELADRPVLNANVLDYLLAHQELISEEWKGKAVFFWGTIYRHSNRNLVVRYLDWDGSQWYWNHYCLDNIFFPVHQAVVGNFKLRLI